MLMELFCDWFEGQFNNRLQTLNNPREAERITARHERTSTYEFYCSYSIHNSKFPYREILFTANYFDGEVFLTDNVTGTSLNFKHTGSRFVCNTERRIGDKLYIYQGILGEGFFKVNDQCYNSKHSLIRGLPDDTFFELKKVM